MSTLSTNSTPPPVSTNVDSYCTKVQRCLWDERTKRTAKITFWNVGGMGAVLIPVPFVNGAIAGFMLFMGTHETVQHPHSVCMQGTYRPIAQSRTWKHISAGAAISGIGWGLGMLALSSHISALSGLGVLGLLGGLGLGLKVAYSDILFPGDYSSLPLQDMA